ncbi:MAG: hypothetical protein LBH88_01070, partial [Candidatus Methanoplasma sp.]|nr:hypothetical protein [Candidatus Methanoplasma sp.]
MERLTEIADEALEILQGLESRREYAIRCSRDIIRETKKMIHLIHVSGCPASKEVLGGLVSDLM